MIWFIRNFPIRNAKIIVVLSGVLYTIIHLGPLSSSRLYAQTDDTQIFLPYVQNGQPSSFEPPYVRGEIIIQLAPSVLAASTKDAVNLNSFEKSSGLQIRGIRPLIHLPNNMQLESGSALSQYFVLTLSLDADVITAGQLLLEDPDIISAMPNYLFQLSDQPTDPYFQNNEDGESQWVLRNDSGANLRVEDAWDITVGSPDVVVAVLDTGFDVNHPDLAQKNTQNGWNFINNSDDVMDTNGHGTAVSGIIGAISDNGSGVAGMSWLAKIMPIRVCDSGGCPFDNVVSGIVFAADRKANIINMSLAFSNRRGFGGLIAQQSMQEAIDFAHDRGAIVIASSGNNSENLNNSDGNHNLPTELDHVIAVGATNENDERCNIRTCGFDSGWGAMLDVMAPGSLNIWTTDIRGGPGNPQGGGLNGYSDTDFYGNFGGTSAAAPFVSGLVALMLSVNPDLSPDEVESILKRTSVDLGTTGRDDHYGSGRIDAFAAVSAVPLLTPILQSPADRSEEIDLKPSFSWTSSPTATQYELEISISSNFENSADSMIKFSQNTELTLSDGLSPNTTYYWRVRFYNGFELSDWSEIWSFTTLESVPLPPSDLWQARYYVGDVCWWDANCPISPSCMSELVGPELHHTLGTNSPCNNMNGDNWVGDYQATINFNAGDYVFRIEHDDKAKVWLNGQNIADRGDAGSDWICPARSLSGNMDLRVLLHEEGGDAGIHLTWTTDPRVCIPDPPDMPILKSPANNARIVYGHDLILQWNNSSRATGYRIEYEQINVGNPHFNETSGLQWQLNAKPSPVGQYRWQVQALNEGGYSDWSGDWYFTIIPNSPHNLAITNETHAQLTLSWTHPGDEIQGFKVYRDGILISTVSTLTSQFVDSDVNCDTTYTYSVVAYHGRIESDPSNSVNGTARCLKSPTLIAPVNDYLATDNQVTFSWNPVSEATKYQLQVDTSLNFSTPRIDNTTSNTNYSSSALLSDGTYYWRARSGEGTDNWSAWSTTWQFTIQTEPVCDVPGVPILAAPLDGTTVNINTPTFDWNPTNYSNSYQFQIDNNMDFSSPERDIITAATDYSSTVGLADDIYHWRVRGQNTSQGCNLTGSWSDPARITVDTTGPAPPVLISPENNASLSDGVPLLDWNNSSDATQYQVQVDNNTDFSAPEIDTIVNSSEYALVSSLNEGLYRWRVRTKDTVDNWGQWSQAWQFTIITPAVCHQPNTPTLQWPINSVLSNNTPTFSWLQANHASAYQIQIFSDNGSLLTDLNVEAINYTPTSPLLDGSYTWQVRSLNISNGCDVSSPFSDDESFTITTSVSNDDFDDAYIIDNLPYTNSQNTIGATGTADDPDATCGDSRENVWYRYVATTDGLMRFQTKGYNTRLAIFTGTRGNLTEVECSYNSNLDGWNSRIDLAVSDGVTYHLLVGGGTGDLVIEVKEISPSCNTITQIPKTECLALKAIDDEMIVNSDWGWFDDLQPCMWIFVICRDGHVVELDFDDYDLGGEIPQEIGDLTHLEYLGLYENNLYGSIPGQIGRLANLKDLSLNDNNLSGILTTEVCNLVNLEYLTLHNTKLTGPLPICMSNLTKMNQFSMGDSSLCIPSELEEWVNNIPYFFGYTSCDLPAAPSGLSATSLSSTEIRLEWIDNSNNELGFFIDDDSSLVATVGSNITTYTVSNLEPNSYHCYHLRAYNNTGNSAWTEWACTTTEATAITELSIRVHFQSRDNSESRPHNVPIKVKITNPVNSAVVFETSEWTSVTPSNSGNWGRTTIDVSGADIVAGQTYNIAIKGAMHLAKKISVTLTEKMVIDYTDLNLNPDGVLLAGDITQDNLVDISDFNRWQEQFGEQPPDSPDPESEVYRSDLDGDGIIDVSDFQILRNNSGKQGDDF